ncbi:hypothetical protein GUITHDRAFT_119499 [Guillardia theta CCMP2712]|uniref:Uncharacterized protein n=1 Tax=Guillardia theta (strain CCMP2712) TaxID=905079 RepID=L1IDK3_GUITC|nr:hypothetical protein GUITHDRAFT_119499 [Guillardia theta CCMP2712]EKX34331.1 hypothetical protein GUITHDRAFT_119499 [Guillardia theta CCMP2712]|eukprot:XP_005821311.1 hypothetical protein GUITHDRAFT_119499 [Guillardia theta CCMP2712]
MEVQARRAAEEEYAIFVPKDAREAKFSEQGSYIASNEYELPKGGTWSKFKTKGYCDDVIRKVIAREIRELRKSSSKIIDAI